MICHVNKIHFDIKKEGSSRGIWQDESSKRYIEIMPFLCQSADVAKQCKTGVLFTGKDPGGTNQKYNPEILKRGGHAQVKKNFNDKSKI